jgi:hypothetical protein
MSSGRFGSDSSTLFDCPLPLAVDRALKPPSSSTARRWGWVLASLARFDRSLADDMRVCSLLSARWPAIHWLAASMQMGVEIHLHQGKPGVRAANTHRVAQTLLCG